MSCSRIWGEAWRFRGYWPESKKLGTQLGQSPQSESQQPTAERQNRTTSERSRLCRCSTVWTDSPLRVQRHQAQLSEMTFAYVRFAWTAYGKRGKALSGGPVPVLSAETTFLDSIYPLRIYFSTDAPPFWCRSFLPLIQPPLGGALVSAGRGGRSASRPYSSNRPFRREASYFFKTLCNDGGRVCGTPGWVTSIIRKSRHKSPLGEKCQREAGFSSSINGPM